MKFFIGDKVKNTMRDREGVITAIGTVLADVDYGCGPQTTSIAYLELLSKRTPFQNALCTSPETLNEFAAIFLAHGRMEISCGPSYVERAADRVSANSKFSSSEALDYLNVVTEKTVGMKYDMLVAADSVPVDLAERLGVVLYPSSTDNGRKAGFGKRALRGELQINCTELAEYLLREHNFTPRRYSWEPTANKLFSAAEHGDTIASAL